MTSVNSPMANTLRRHATVASTHELLLSVHGRRYDFAIVGKRPINSVAMFIKSAGTGDRTIAQTMPLSKAPPSESLSIVLRDTGPSPYLRDSTPMRTKQTV